MKPSVVLVLTAVLLAAGGCQRSKDGGPAERLETVEVGEGFDVGLTTAYDEKAKPVGPPSVKTGASRSPGVMSRLTNAA